MKVEPLVAATRGGQLESMHFGAVAVADAAGGLRASLGGPDLMTFLRSAAKPFQALPFLETGAADAIGASERELAVVCGSHTGTDEHAQVVSSLLTKSGASEAELQCGIHPPIDRETARRLWSEGKPASPLRNNCSGKHAGMVATARHAGESTADYLSLEHPVQQRITAALCQITETPAADLWVAVDGCSAPIFAVPLRAAATAYARLADPQGLPPERRRALGRIFRAMTAHPRLVAGEKEFDTRLMAAGGGRIVAKSGAEGVLAVGLSPARGQPALGLVIKIADGDPRMRARPLVARQVLAGLSLVDSEVLQAISPWVDDTVTSRKGKPVGNLEFLGKFDERPE